MAEPTSTTAPAPLVSVIMPTYNQAAFIGRAIGSLLRQDVDRWELAIVDDGSTDATAAAVAPFTEDPRISYHRLAGNEGLGAAANRGIDRTSARIVTYLPSDDRLERDHLSALLGVMGPSVALAWTGMLHHGSQRCLDAPPDMSLQLVQVAHRRTADRWIERDRLETDDLDDLLWSALRSRGTTASTGLVTCEWTDHPDQRHKAILERHDGGLNVFRRRYRIDTPLRFRSSDGWLIDERSTYEPVDRRYARAGAGDGLRILLVGELSFNPERILAFEERGHQLFGLWTDEPLGPQSVGPLPFGNVHDLPADWRSALDDVRPDVVYALLNWRAVPLAHAVLRASGSTPFVWHFKESPHRCMRRGTWPLLVDLVTEADLCILASEEERDWFEAALPGRIDPERTAVVDGDLPKADWLEPPPATPLSAADGDVHTVVLGRPLGLDAGVVQHLADEGIHVHLHGPVRALGVTGSWVHWLDDARAVAPNHLHVHPHVTQPDWRRVLSRYDAGWLHHVAGDNGGDIAAATWDDLNIPGRLPVYLAAGLPVLQPRSPGRTAMQRLIEEEAFGVLYEDMDDLCRNLRDRKRIAAARRAVDASRHRYTFDHHVDDLIARFETLVDGR